jgi:CheY-like chemotaxis protein
VDLLFLSSDQIGSVVTALPDFIVAVLIAVFVVVNWSKFGALISNISKVKVAGLEMDFAARTLETAKPNQPVAHSTAAALTQRMAHAGNAMARTRILWVDDTPLYNRGERTYLRAGGATVVNVRSTEEAMRTLSTDDFTLVITDMKRMESEHPVSQAGIQLAACMREKGYRQPIIGYVGTVDPALPVPEEWVGITAKPDELINLILDEIK